MADSSPARAKSERHLTDVSTILAKLKDEVAFLQDEVARKGAGFYAPLAHQLMTSAAAVADLTAVLQGADAGLAGKDADGIPASVNAFLRANAPNEPQAEEDFGKAIRSLQKTTMDCRVAYQNASVSAKGLVEDADKLDIVVKACQTEYIKLKLLNNNAKAYVNAKRLKWQRQAHSFRYWAEFVHFETIGAIQREMEDLVAEQQERILALDEEFAKATAAFDAQLTGQRRIKCMMLLKKMKNSRMQTAFATWDDMVKAIMWERIEAEKAALIAELQGRFAHLSAEEIERKMRQFLKRWVNRKMIGPFRTWKGLIEAKKQAEQDALLEAERARLAGQLAAMQDNMALKKLKMYFARVAGLMKETSFRALAVHARQSKAKKMLDSEAGKRLKAFLASKLASTLRKCYTAIIRNHDNIAAENMKNNDKAKKVGLMLEKIARGLVHRCFNAFVRYFQDQQEERAAQDAINARLGAMDEYNRAKLRVFLMNKDKQKLMMFFKQWVEVAQCKGLLELYEMLDKEEAGRKAAEEELAALLAASGDAGSALKGLEDEQSSEEDEINRMNQHNRGLLAELRKLTKQISAAESDLDSETALRAEIQAKNKVTRDELAQVTAARDELASELMGVAGDVSTVHKDAHDFD
eukprot:TRINITY_DN621_c0_g1_i1.p1 TRINITY_DN621_c0_g1~~TRINITY_DN621_c0_g1_i1.p1  ORF type:complete len:638 (-),score=247.81 TRINITY_DN621_c0_g1_i1:189-2102(-)